MRSSLDSFERRNWYFYESELNEIVGVLEGVERGNTSEGNLHSLKWDYEVFTISNVDEFLF